eukprot:COSAG02_NODE_691_length_18445_cov_23.541099_2_plen_929_part_00
MAKLRVIFKMIQPDESVGICSTELRHMLLNMGENVSEHLVADMVAVVDVDGDSLIGFDEFADVMTGARQMRRTNSDVPRFENSSRLSTASRMKLDKVLQGDEHPANTYSNEQMRHVFDEMDEDGGGTLDRTELVELAAKLGRAVKRRDIIDAMQYMDPLDTGEVSYQMFRNWMLDTNLHWASLLVLPEGTVETIRQTAAADLDSLLAERDPAMAEWKRLSLLLKAMGSVIECWGKPEDMYGLKIVELEKQIVSLASLEAGPDEAPAMELTTLQKEHRQWSPDRRKEKKLELQQELVKISPSNSLCYNNGKDAAWSGLTHTDIEREARARTCFLHPNSRFRAIWDIVQVCLLLYLLTVLPLRLSFGIDVAFNTFAYWFDVAVDLYFWTDIVVNFRTGYYDARGGLVISQHMISVKYLKGWFVVDLVTCLPISYVLMSMYGVDAADKGKEIRLFKILRLFKLAKLLRVTRLLRMIERYRVQLRSFMQAFGGLLLALVVVLFTHLIACVWYVVGTIEQPASILGTSRTPGYDGWVYRSYGLGCDQQGEHIDPDHHWSSSDGMSELIDGEVCSMPSAVTRYMTAMYWALMTLSTVGYGDYTAHTDLEKIWSMVSMLFGALIFAAITGSLSARIMAEKGSVQIYNTKMDEMRVFCASNDLPISLTRKIEGYYCQMWSKKFVFNDNEILERLPWTLVKPVLEWMYEDIMGSAALFSKLMDSTTCPEGREIIAELSLRLRKSFATSGLVVMQQGQIGDSMFFVKSGEVEVYKNFTKHDGTQRRLVAEGEPEGDEVSTVDDDKGERLGRLGPRGFFGEMGVMDFQHVGSVVRVRTRTVIAKTDCDLLNLRKEDLDELRGQYIELDRSMNNFESGLMQRTCNGGLRAAATTNAASRRGVDQAAIEELIANIELKDLARAVKKRGYNMVKDIVPVDDE